MSRISKKQYNMNAYRRLLRDNKNLKTVSIPHDVPLKMRLGLAKAGFRVERS